MGSAFKILQQNSLGFQLTPISIRELFFLENAPCDIYGLKDDLYTLILKKNALVNQVVLRELINSGQYHLFVHHNERSNLIELQQTNLRNITRSLSMGDPLLKGKKQLNLLSINMGYLYDNPTDDEILNLQLQSVKNLASFLSEHPELHEELYKSYQKQGHHFVFAQPLLSSLFLIGLLKYSKIYSNKEIESLFVTSFFKDIGMSAIPTEKYDQEELSDEDKVLLANHAHHSVQILNGRIPLSPAHQKIIENHHSFSLLTQDISHHRQGAKLVTGFETMIVTVMDVISAMIAERPYRKSKSLFESLDTIKVLITDQYPQEFKLIVTYFRNFFTQI